MPEVDIFQLGELMRILPSWFQRAWVISGVLFAFLSVCGVGWIYWARASGPTETAPSDASEESTTASVTRETDIGNGLRVANFGTINVNFNTFGSVPVERLSVRDVAGAESDVEFFLLYSRATWAYGRDSSFIDSADRIVDLEVFLSSPEFLRRSSQFTDVLCIGLASGASEPPIVQNISLAQDRAVRLCRMVRTAVRSDSLRITAVGLGYHTTTTRKNTAAERRQRGVLLIGVRAAQSVSVEELVSQLAKSGVVEGVDLRSYALVESGQPLQFERITSGASVPR